MNIPLQHLSPCAALGVESYIPSLAGIARASPEMLAHNILSIIHMLTSQVVGTGTLSFANDAFSTAASIILFPFMIDVVQMTIFLRPVGP